MILKLCTGINQWGYFESDEIFIEKVLANNLFDNDVKWILQEGTEQQKNKEVNYIHLIYETGSKRIATNRVGYLLNNEGKTVDKI
jgi:hypothetical protein